MHRAKINAKPKKTDFMKKSDARERVINFLGKERVQKLQEKWESLDTSNHSFDGDGDICDGILLCLRNMGLSFIQIRSILNVGNSRLTRITKINKDQKKKSESLLRIP